MNRNGIIGILVIGLFLGGLVLFARRRPAVEAPVSYPFALEVADPGQVSSTGSMNFIAREGSGPRYRNKEIRKIKWNELNLPVEIEITRDYSVS
jgi:hypothetical protein